MQSKHDLGQYFTTHIDLKNKLTEFILNNPSLILEPSIGRGDLIEHVKSRFPKTAFDMFEIDKKIKLLKSIKKKDVIYGDFMEQSISKKYTTIIGNPPFVKTKTGNLYIDFIEKCIGLLDGNGELIFIVPSDFLKLTGSAKLLTKMMNEGTFTHIYHPHNEKLFEDASIDVIIFRYCNDTSLEKKVLYNDVEQYIHNGNGMITFSHISPSANMVLFKDIFDVYVGLVSGKEEVYKNESLGNIEVLNGEDKRDKYIFITEYPCDNHGINEHLLENKQILINRKIKKFGEKNWFEWGAPRNISTINKCKSEDCIYLYNLTRRSHVAFTGKVEYFGAGLLMLKPKKPCDLQKVVDYLNSETFKSNFLFSGRFKIGHRQIQNSSIPVSSLSNK